MYALYTSMGYIPVCAHMYVQMHAPICALWMPDVDMMYLCYSWPYVSEMGSFTGAQILAGLPS